MYRRLTIHDHTGKALAHLNKAITAAFEANSMIVHADLLKLRTYLLNIRNHDYSQDNRVIVTHKSDGSNNVIHNDEQ